VRSVDLFAGAGGASLGLRDAGYEHLACIEWDEDAAATLDLAGFPAIHGDVRDLRLVRDLKPDLVWSSFPCQDWSTAGRRQGPDGDRNGWPWTIDAIDAMKPRWFIAENVTGLTQHKGACDPTCLGPEVCPAAYLDLVILEQLRSRFSFVETRLLNASDYGVPQHRRRIIIVAGPARITWPAPTHGKPTDQIDLFGRQLRPWKTVRDALGLNGELSASRNSENRPTQERPAPTTEPSPTIGGKGNQMFRVIGGGSNPREPGKPDDRSYRDLTDEPCTTIPANQIGNAGPWVEIVTGLNDGGKSGGSQGGRSIDSPSPTVRACQGTSMALRAKWRKGEHPEILDRPSAPVSATEYKGTNGKESTGWTANGGPARASDTLWLSTGRRRLTVEECAKLQGFPDGHPFQGTKTERYRQVGNAVPPGMAEAVARAVMESDEGRAHDSGLLCL
jgi:DNA (cytosine-5)-methyltransferase 1